MNAAIDEAKDAILRGCGTMCGRGYVLGTSGNISSRIRGEELFVITPTALPYDEMTADDLVVMDMTGKRVAGHRAPSMEFLMHRNILATRPDVAFIVHTHSTFATAASSMEGVDTVPLVDIETALYIGGAVPVAPFAPPGSAALAENAARCIGDIAGVLLEGHGAIGVGKTMRDAMTACDIIERNCEMFLLIRAAGKLRPLPEGPLLDLCAFSRKKRGLGAE